MFKMLKNQKGMTLVELLAVMVIVGIIAAISIPAIGNLMENSRKDAHIANAQNLQEAARLWVTSNESYLTTIYSATPTTEVVIELQSDGSWKVKKGGTSGTEITSDAPFVGYLETFKDPHSKDKYNSAYIQIKKVNNKYEYKVYMDGVKTDIGTSTAPVDPSTLNREQLS